MDSIGYIVRRDTICYEYAKALFENVQSIFAEKIQDKEMVTHVRACLCDTIARRQTMQELSEFNQLDEKHTRLVTYIKSTFGAHIANERLSYDTLMLEADRFIYVYVELLEPCLAKQTVTQCMQNRLSVIAALTDHLKNIYNNVLSDINLNDKSSKLKHQTPPAPQIRRPTQQEPRKVKRSVHKQLLSDNEEPKLVNTSTKEPQREDVDGLDDHALDELLFGL